MQIKINKKEYKVKTGETVLDVCRREGIRIPTLCSHEELKREAVCRLCLVEVNGSGKLVTSCTTKVADGMEVETESKNISRARAVNLELLWSDHAGKCVKCKKNRRCELQKLAEEYKIENFHFVPRKGELTSSEENELLRDNWSRVVVEENNPVIARTTEYCVECRRCINICPVAAYSFNHRAGDTVVGTPYNEDLDCIFCGACVAHCPTGALPDQGDIVKVMQDLDDTNILSVALIDPAIFKTIGNEIVDADKMENFVGSLRAMGFEKVFNLDWSFEKYAEKVMEVIHPHYAKGAVMSAKHKVHISSFCPSAELYIKKYFPELAGNIIQVKRPEEIMAAAIKNEYATTEKISPKNIRVILLSSCVARKKLLADGIDHIVTVRELGRIAREKKIADVNVGNSALDNFLGKTNKEYADLYKYGQLSSLLSKKIKKDFLIGAANGVPEIKNALSSILKREKQYDFLEVMICPEGCDSGGGQSLNC